MSNKITQQINDICVTYEPDLSLHCFEKIKNQPWAMLLRSPSDNHPDSRYDILVANPVAKIITTGNETEVITRNEHYTSTSDPFEILSKTQEELLPTLDENLWSEYPFVGGALGYFSYDLGRRIEKIPNEALNDISLPDMAIGLYSWALIVDHHRKTANIVGLDVQTVFSWLITDLPTLSEKDYFKTTGPWTTNMSKASYQNKFNAIQEYLKSGDCYQINLTQRFKTSYEGSEWYAYKKLETDNKAPFSGFLRFDDHSILSISPERFLKLDNQHIETKPIKGTKPRSENKKEDQWLAQQLENSDKDQSENLMIVDLLRNDIGRVAQPGSVKVPKLFSIESFPAVHHMVSTIIARLDKHKTVTDLLRATFPGGSITGAPKVRAMEIIEELEPNRRSVYCGSIGYISRNRKMDTNIAIRTLIAKKQNLYVWAGGAIVADSKVDSEYQETYDKLAKILPCLAEKN
ncbi:aminodeoxychorismate synthase component I [Vibrio salinus]|uniref:aminodeoxychorismate synthase component I n=1 Tax=Vibrio salinus TaxID=2899784 RepID=UPI001E53F9C3|nr:aminodeoxychorismate synthase component I [Vibrio salinus]MCE0492449.1 aminodeoxychorismate synthase component I [Vibrio salinus]